MIGISVIQNYGSDTRMFTLKSKGCLCGPGDRSGGRDGVKDWSRRRFRCKLLAKSARLCTRLCTHRRPILHRSSSFFQQGCPRLPFGVTCQSGSVAIVRQTDGTVPAEAEATPPLDVPPLDDGGLVLGVACKIVIGAG